MDVLETRDFCFTGALGSAGARIEARAPNRFAIALGAAPNHPEWANKLNFEINRPARNVALELDVSFASGLKPSFNEYPQAYAIDDSDWAPVDWVHGRLVSTAEDLLRLPLLSWNRLVVGTQIPLSYESLMARVATWRRSPYVECVTLGATATGRQIVRLTVADSQGAPMQKRWVHYITHQHPGEFNAQWRMIGMIDWLLGDHAAAADVRRRMVFHFVPCMSPDGPAHGWYRVNATGHDMNRTYRSEGADARRQPPEAYCVQRDFEAQMRSNAPIATTWSLHTWSGLVEPILTPGPEFGSRLGAWEQFRDVLAQCDPEGLIKPLKCRSGEQIPLAKAGTWSAGPHSQFGITGVLCEGGSHFDRQRNEASGAVLAGALGTFYAGLRDA